VKRTPVRTGCALGGRIEIVEGLKAGQKVVTEGVVKLADGMKVRVAGPMRAGRRGRGRSAARHERMKLSDLSVRGRSSPRWWRC
jgi:hypothetical protein